MSIKRVTITLEGLKKRNGAILASDFLREINLLLGILRETERSLVPKHPPSIYFEVIGLSHSSPAQATFQAQTSSRDFDYREEVFNSFFGTIKNLDADNTEFDFLSPDILRDFIGMIRPIGRTLEAVFISSDGTSYGLTPAIERTIERVIGSEEKYPGSVRGMLEAINLHRDANVFRIYPDYGPSKINCHFSSELESLVIKAIGHFIEAKGTLIYNQKMPYPHEILVDNIEIFPKDDLLPSLSDLRGIAPDATGKMSSEEFIRNIRNASI